MQETRGCSSRVQPHYLWSPMWYGHYSQSLLNPLLNLPSSSRCILLWNMSRTHFIHNASLNLSLLNAPYDCFSSLFKLLRKAFCLIFLYNFSMLPFLVYEIFMWWCHVWFESVSAELLYGSLTLSNWADFLLSWNTQTQETPCVFVSAKSGCRGHVRATRHLQTL